MPLFGKVRRQVFDRMHDADVEMIGPVAFGRTGHDVPIVAGLKVDEDRGLAGRVHDVGKRQVGQRCPADEMRVRLERVVIVVQERNLGSAGVDNRVAGASFVQRVIVPRRDGLQMCFVGSAERRIFVGIVAHDHAIIPCCWRRRRVPSLTAAGSRHAERPRNGDTDETNFMVDLRRTIDTRSPCGGR